MPSWSLVNFVPQVPGLGPLLLPGAEDDEAEHRHVLYPVAHRPRLPRELREVVLGTCKPAEV